MTSCSFDSICEGMNFILYTLCRPRMCHNDIECHTQVYSSSVKDCLSSTHCLNLTSFHVYNHCLICSSFFPAYCLIITKVFKFCNCEFFSELPPGVCSLLASTLDFHVNYKSSISCTCMISVLSCLYLNN